MIVIARWKQLNSIWLFNFIERMLLFKLISPQISVFADWNDNDTHKKFVILSFHCSHSIIFVIVFFFLYPLKCVTNNNFCIDVALHIGAANDDNIIDFITVDKWLFMIGHLLVSQFSLQQNEQYRLDLRQNGIESAFCCAKQTADFHFDMTKFINGQ